MEFQNTPLPETTLVVILGASQFPKSPSLGSNSAFELSAKAFQDYLLDLDGYGLSSENMLSLVNTSDAPSQIDEKIAEFITTRSTQLKSAGEPPRDILFYYVGHGAYTDDGHIDYFLALSSTSDMHKSSSGYLIRSLAHTLKTSATQLRKFLILDCCFSAAAYTSFQSSPLEVAAQQTLSNLPEKGTTLLCSASRTEPSRALPGYTYTMFSTALLQALKEGDQAGSDNLSFRELRDLITKNINENFPSGTVRPEIHSPDQRQGSVDQIPFFPNLAKKLETLQARNEGLIRKVNELARQLLEETKRNENLSKALEELKAQAKAQEQSTEANQVIDTSSYHYLNLFETAVQNYYGLSNDERSDLSIEIWEKLLETYRANKTNLLWALIGELILGGVIMGILGSQLSLSINGWAVGYFLLSWISCLFFAIKLLKEFKTDLLFSYHTGGFHVRPEELEILETHNLMRILTQHNVVLSGKFMMSRTVYFIYLSFSILGVLSILYLVNLVNPVLRYFLPLFK